MATVTVAEAQRRISEIDKMFEGATGWGSWMVMAANEREDLVDRLNSQYKMGLKHKHQARTASGARTD
jgi:hypothetical protein